MSVTVEQSCQWLLNNRASIVPATVEESCQWLLSNRASDCWTIVPATVEYTDTVDIYHYKPIIMKTSSWLLSARFCGINNTRYLIKIQQNNKYWLYRNANPLYFSNWEKKRQYQGAGWNKGLHLLDTGHKLNVHKTSWTSSKRLMYVKFTSCVQGGSSFLWINLSKKTLPEADLGLLQHPRWSPLW